MAGSDLVSGHSDVLKEECPEQERDVVGEYIEGRRQRDAEGCRGCRAEGAEVDLQNMHRQAVWHAGSVLRYVLLLPAALSLCLPKVLDGGRML